MGYDPYKVWDINRTRSDALGGPRLYVRCDAMRDGDRCDYRIHRGTHHAAQSGGHRWIEAPIGYCSVCNDPVYPLSVKSLRVDGQHEYVPMCCDDAFVRASERRAPDPFGSTAEWASR